MSYSLLEAYRELNEKKNNKINIVNSSVDNEKYVIKTYCDPNSWSKEVYKTFGFKKNKQAEKEYLKVMELIQRESINTLHKMDKVKRLHGPLGNEYEIKWNISNIQYRIYCFREGNVLYLMIPFIKGNGDKDTDAAGIVAKDRYLAM